MYAISLHQKLKQEEVEEEAKYVQFLVPYTPSPVVVR